MRGKSEGSENRLTKEHFLENAVGRCPEVDVQIGGVPLRCFLDTGCNVSTLTESFLRDHLHEGDEDMHCTARCLGLTAANKLPLPYLGYVELDIQVMGITIHECGFLIIKDGDTEEPDTVLPGIIGMNITKRCRQLVLAEYTTTSWIRSGERLQNTCTLLKPGKTFLPGGLMVLPMVISTNNPVFPVQVINLSQEDIWLSPKTRLGTLSQCQCTGGDPIEVAFQHISADNEEVTINPRDGQEQ